MRTSGPDFALHVARDGYAWWYIDAISDDGANGLTIIAFIGSVFSPYYKWARRKGGIDPLEHCALNVALYGPPRRWAMTERGATQVARAADSFTIGPSALHWRGDRLVIEICERGAPFPHRLRGRITVRPQMLFETTFSLDANGRHRWRPIAPVAHVDVEMDAPGLRWSGSGYFDHNNGDEPLESGFHNWDWSRAHAGRDALIHYDARTRAGGTCELAMRFRPDGSVETSDAPPAQALPRTAIWRVGRTARCDAEQNARVVKTLEDTPFYARSIIRSSLTGERVTGFHESLDLDRFCKPVVQAMLPFRMPRITR